MFHVPCRQVKEGICSVFQYHLIAAFFYSLANYCCKVRISKANKQDMILLLRNAISAVRCNPTETPQPRTGLHCNRLFGE